MTTITVAAPEMIMVADIIIDNRLREDLGDIAALAESIERFGLIQPIVVDADNILVAGGRRLAAVQQLGWTEVPVRRYGNLTARERLDLELEENERRKNLTGTERSKAIARLADLARAVAREEAAETEPAELRADATQKSRGRGRPAEPGSLRDIESRLGINEATIRAAERHARVVEFYPELTPLPQYTAFRVAERLDALPKEKRSPFLGRLAHETDYTWSIERDLDQAVYIHRGTDPRVARERARRTEQRAAKREQRRPANDAWLASLGLGLAPDPDEPARTMTPEEEEELGRREMRAAFAKARDEFWDILSIRPRALRKALEPTDMREVREFIDKLRPWVDEWAEVLR